MPKMPSQPENFFQFEKLLVALAKAAVDFAVVGGVAISLNGFIRATDDVDIIVNEAPDNVRRMLDCLTGWGEGWARELQPHEFTPQEGSIRVMEDFNLDIFTRMQGRSLNDFRPRLRCITIDGALIRFVSPADLISLKEGSWREKDQIDVAAMKKILENEPGGK